MRLNMRLETILCVIGCAAASILSPAWAEEDKPVTAQNESKPAPQVDRDGKVIYGYALMNTTELGGYRSQLHFMKTIEERDAARAEHRKLMDKRAAERGVKIDE
jgi:hypothetical protein